MTLTLTLTELTRFLGALALALCWLIPRRVSKRLKTEAELRLENETLRLQLAQVKGELTTNKRRKPRTNQVFWVIWTFCTRSITDAHRLAVFHKKRTVVGWHKKAFKIYWKKKSQPKGRPPLSIQARLMIWLKRPPSMNTTIQNGHTKESAEPPLFLQNHLCRHTWMKPDWNFNPFLAGNTIKFVRLHNVKPMKFHNL